MTYSFLMLYHDNGEWMLEDHATGATHAFDLKQQARHTVEKEAFRGNVHWLGGQVTKPVGCVVKKRRGSIQDFLVNEERFMELIHDKMGAGGMGSYHVRRGDESWFVEYVPYEHYFGGPETDVLTHLHNKSDARENAHDLLWNETNGIALVEWDWYNEEVTRYENAPFLWDWLYDTDQEV